MFTVAYKYTTQLEYTFNKTVIKQIQQTNVYVYMVQNDQVL